jgi:decaprenylphospho-beta-D-ribofuranose 2-oxidase
MALSVEGLAKISVDSDRAAPPVAAAVVPCEPELPSAALAGWGNYPVVQGCERRSEDLERITRGAVLTRGLGRSYGDSSLPPPGRYVVAGSPLADRLLAFDAATGVVRAEAGFTLMNLNRLFFGRGWFTPVTPGTHYVTLGGMVAADVHGKNHHVAGCFGEHVRRLRMRVADGRIIECSETHEPELFRATLGGMGLTGHLLEVEFQMQHIASPWIWQESEQVRDLEHALDRLHAASREWPFTVLWSDFLPTGPSFGRGLLMKGRWAEPHEAPPTQPRWRRALALPVQLPSWLVQPWMVQTAWFGKYWLHGARTRAGIIHPEAFFYPLDIVRQWNRVYGRRGFTQYQAVLPGPSSDPRHARFVRTLRAHGGAVYLGVIKDCGAEGKGMLSFPKPGITYALDIPIDATTQTLVDALNEVVAGEGGRVYLAKDAFTRPEHFRAMEPRLDAWTAVRRAWDPHGRLKSAQSIRLFGDRP